MGGGGCGCPRRLARARPPAAECDGFARVRRGATVWARPPDRGSSPRLRTRRALQDGTPEGARRVARGLVARSDDPVFRLTSDNPQFASLAWVNSFILMRTL